MRLVLGTTVLKHILCNSGYCFVHSEEAIKQVRSLPHFFFFVQVVLLHLAFHSAGG